MDTLKILNRQSPLFSNDLSIYNDQIEEIVRKKTFLVIGGGGSIGQAVVKELYKRSAKMVHVVDLNENYLAELIRDIRSSHDDITCEIDTFALDCGEDYFLKFMMAQRYDYVLNLAAMKHVRSENSVYSMYRMIKTNMVDALRIYEHSQKLGVEKYFCVSTDKAANPANFMGASKRAMELALFREDIATPISGARFANVAFSNGSLLESFKVRVDKRQPLSAPSDISRFFITDEEAGIICLFSTILGKSHEILFPYNDQEMQLTKFSVIAENYLRSIGKKPVIANSEREARELCNSLDLSTYWPVNLFHSDTVGEKPFEEFYTTQEPLKYGDYTDLASIKFTSKKTLTDIQNFILEINSVTLTQPEAKENFLNIVKCFVPTFEHIGGSKYLNGRM